MWAWCEFAWRPTILRSEVKRLEAEGVEFLTEPQVGHGGLADVAVCKDPDGTLIELLQVYLERWQVILSGDPS